MTTETEQAKACPSLGAIMEQAEKYAAAHSDANSRFAIGGEAERAELHKTMLANMVAKLHARISGLENESRIQSANLKAAQADLQIAQDRHAREIEAIGAGGVQRLRHATGHPRDSITVYFPQSHGDLNQICKRVLTAIQAEGPATDPRTSKRIMNYRALIEWLSAMEGRK